MFATQLTVLGNLQGAAQNVRQIIPQHRDNSFRDGQVHNMKRWSLGFSILDETMFRLRVGLRPRRRPGPVRSRGGGSLHLWQHKSESIPGHLDILL
jgi:hypothetical protein